MPAIGLAHLCGSVARIVFDQQGRDWPWATARFVEILQSETSRLVNKRSEFLASFSEADLTYLVERWEMKVRFCQGGDMKWGNYMASRES